MESLSSPNKVVYLDSDTLFLDLMEMFFESDEVEVITRSFQSFEEGITEIERFLIENKPDLILWDIAPPVRESWCSFRKISKAPWAKKTRFILTTTLASKLIKEMGDKVNEYGILEKPIDFNILTERINEELKSIRESEGKNQEAENTNIYREREY